MGAWFDPVVSGFALAPCLTRVAVFANESFGELGIDWRMRSETSTLQTLANHQGTGMLVRTLHSSVDSSVRRSEIASSRRSLWLEGWPCIAREFKPQSSVDEIGHQIVSRSHSQKDLLWLPPGFGCNVQTLRICGWKLSIVRCIQALSQSLGSVEQFWFSSQSTVSRSSERRCR